MSVIDEEWKAVHDEAIDAWDLVLDNQDEPMLAHRGGFLTSDDPGYDEARARLAAQAPAMARLLVKLEWSADIVVGYDALSSPGCPSCSGLRAEPVGADFDHWTVGHAADCELQAMLRAIGARG